MERNTFFIEELIKKIKKTAREYKTPLVVTWIIGLFCYLYMFTNKFPNLDDVEYFFSKVAMLSSGRWGLNILSYIIPNYSMPWFHGIISLTLISIAICIVIDIFKIENKVYQGLLAGIIISFASFILLFAYMMTSSSYAVAFLITVLAVDLCEKGGKKNIAISIALFIFSLSIYQAYITVASCLFIIILIKSLMKNKKSIKEVFFRGLQYLFLLAISIIVYLLITKLLLIIFDTTFNEYALNSIPDKNSVFNKISLMYSLFFLFFLRGYTEIINTPFSLIVHILIFLYTFIEIYLRQLKKKQVLNLLGIILLLCILPISINASYWLNRTNTLTVTGFISIYVLIIVVLDKFSENRKVFKSIISIALCLIVLNNIYIANKSYLQMNITYDNAYSFYTSLVTQIKSEPEFDKNTKIALIGKTHNLIYETEEFKKSDIDYNVASENKFFGITDEIINIYSREKFIKYYVGFNAEFATEEEIENISQTKEFENMAEYPYYGSVKKIGDYMVVKFE